MKNYTNKFENLKNYTNKFVYRKWPNSSKKKKQKSETTRMQPIDHLNCLLSIKGIAFINITLPKKKSPGVDVFYEEVYHAFKKN